MQLLDYLAVVFDSFQNPTENTKHSERHSTIDSHATKNRVGFTNTWVDHWNELLLHVKFPHYSDISPAWLLWLVYERKKSRLCIQLVRVGLSQRGYLLRQRLRQSVLMQTTRLLGLTIFESLRKLMFSAFNISHSGKLLPNAMLASQTVAKCIQGTNSPLNILMTDWHIATNYLNKEIIKISVLTFEFISAQDQFNCRRICLFLSRITDPFISL